MKIPGMPGIFLYQFYIYLRILSSGRDIGYTALKERLMFRTSYIFLVVMALVSTACTDNTGTFNSGTCADGIQNQDETGTDCGGVCGACQVVTATCTDGVQNQNEQGIDCGGVCAACESAQPSCSDGFQNQNETGVDCGGVCPACEVSGTCSDGVRNQDETAVDCGGVCSPCPGVVETCSDGLMNQNEEGVDCGGVCAACPTNDPMVGDACDAPGQCGQYVCDLNTGMCIEPVVEENECMTAGPSSDCLNEEVCVTDSNDENGTCEDICRGTACLEQDLVCWTDPEFEEYNTCITSDALSRGCADAEEHERYPLAPMILDVISVPLTGDGACSAVDAHIALVYAPLGLFGQSYTDVVKILRDGNYGLSYSDGSNFVADHYLIDESEKADIADFIPGDVDASDIDRFDYWWVEFYTCDGDDGALVIVDVADDGQGGTSDDALSNAFCL